MTTTGTVVSLSYLFVVCRYEEGSEIYGLGEMGIIVAGGCTNGDDDLDMGLRGP